MLVALHGFTELDIAWREVLGDRDDLWCPLLPGHGWKPVPEQADVGSCAADLAAEISARSDGQAVDLLGYSLGGRVALRLALDYPQLIKRLIVISAHAGTDDPDERAARVKRDQGLADVLREDGIGTFVAWWEQQPVLRMVKSSSEQMTKVLRSRRLNQDPEGLADSLLAYGQGAQDPLWGRLGELAMPTMLMVGEHDAGFRKEMQRMTGQINDCTLAVVPGVGHAAHREAPAQVRRMVENFLGD